MEVDRWGEQNRIAACLKALHIEGAAAKPLLPQLEQLETDLRFHPEAKSLVACLGILGETRKKIASDPDAGTLRPLPAGP